MTTEYDVVIVGGGAVGSAIAYFLMREPGFAGSVAVVERDPTYRTASSALSAGGIRQQYSTEINIRISRFSIGFLRDAATLLAVDGDAPMLGLREPGYLFLASSDGLATLKVNHALQRRLGVAVELLAVDALVVRFPWLNGTGLVAGSLGLDGEGWLDPHSLLQALRRKARSLGAYYIHDEVVGLERAGRSISAVRLASGSRLSCGTVVNAAGPRSRAVAAMAGLHLPVEARKRNVFVVDCRTRLADCPLVIDSSGLWFRPEGDYFICGISPPEERDAEDFGLEVDHDVFPDEVWPLLAARVPAFEASKVVNSWAGHYEYNTFDHNGILGAAPDVPNLICATGFSGHGLQQSPTVGRGISELIAFGEYRTLDLRPLSIERILEGRPLLERNIV